MAQLKDKLKELSDNQGILIKQIIADSGVSQAHFYKVINGQRSLTPELKHYFAQRLAITEAEVEALIPTLSKKKRSSQIENKWVLSLLTVVLFVAVVITWPLNNSHSDIATPMNGALNDRSTFIKDVTIPDGTAVEVGSHFNKIWRIKNSGNVTWQNRYLQRVTLNDKDLCHSPQRVPIAPTAPGEIVDIKVTITAPNLPGSCRLDWKMTDASGTLSFPNLNGLYLIVQVTK